MKRLAREIHKYREAFFTVDLYFCNVARCNGRISKVSIYAADDTISYVVSYVALSLYRKGSS